MSRAPLRCCPEPVDLDAANQHLAGLDAHDRIAWALDCLPGHHLLSSSFGIQAAVMLHLVQQVAPGLPVVFIDTGYHFAETYRFVDQLNDRLALNLRVYRAPVSGPWQEARHGQRWQQGREGLEAYNRDNKVEPMQRALADMRAGTWFSGLRRSQSKTRAEVPFATAQWSRIKVQPIADWTDRDVHAYLQAHDLPYHPLREQGYVSIGDWHTTRSLKEVDSEDEARFFGLVRECGLHDLSG